MNPTSPRFKWSILVITIVFLLVTTYVLYEYNKQGKVTYIYKDDSMFDVELGAYIRTYEQRIEQLNTSTKQQILLAEAKENLDLSNRYLESDEYVSALRWLNEATYLTELAKLKDANSNGITARSLDSYEQQINERINQNTKTREGITPGSIYRFEWYVYSKYMDWSALNQLNLASENINLGKNNEALNNVAYAISDSNIALLTITLTEERGVMGEGFVDKHLHNLLKNESDKTFNEITEKIGGLDDVNKNNALNKLSYRPKLDYMRLFNDRVVSAEVNAYYMLKNTDQSISEIRTNLTAEINIANEEIRGGKKLYSDMVFPSMLLDLAKVSLNSGSTREDFILGLSYAQEARKFIRVWNDIVTEWSSKRDLESPKNFDVEIKCGSLKYCTTIMNVRFDSKRPDLNLKYIVSNIHDPSIRCTHNGKQISSLIRDNYVEINTKLEEGPNDIVCTYTLSIEPKTEIIFFDLPNPFGDRLYPFDTYTLVFAPKVPHTTGTIFMITIPQGYILSEKSGEYVNIMNENHKTKNLEQFSIKDNSYRLETGTFHQYDGKRVIVSFQKGPKHIKTIFFLIFLIYLIFGVVGHSIVDKYSRTRDLDSGKLSANQMTIICGFLLILISLITDFIQIVSLDPPPPNLSMMTLSPFIGVGLGWFAFIMLKNIRKYL